MTHTGALKCIDEIEHTMVFVDGAKVEMDEVVGIELNKRDERIMYAIKEQNMSIPGIITLPN